LFPPLGGQRLRPGLPALEAPTSAQLDGSGIFLRRFGLRNIANALSHDVRGHLIHVARFWLLWLHASIMLERTRKGKLTISEDWYGMVHCRWSVNRWDYRIRRFARPLFAVCDALVNQRLLSLGMG